MTATVNAGNDRDRADPLGTVTPLGRVRGRWNPDERFAYTLGAVTL